MPTLDVIIASTRPGRVGLPIGKWFFERAKAHGKFDVELVDLAEVNLPFLDEPKHPRLRQYEHEHTKKWSARVAAADAFVIVTPEYNYGMPAPLVNALDFLYVEWNYKPVGFVSYGGVSGGTRAVQAARQLVMALKMTPIVEGVAIPFFQKLMDDKGGFKGDEGHEKAGVVMLDELVRWCGALKGMRG